MARVRRSGQGGACPAGHAGEGCVGAGAMARGSTRERRASDRARVRGGARGEGVRGHGCAGGELCAPAGDWRAGGRCEQRRVMRGVGGGELAQHAR